MVYNFAFKTVHKNIQMLIVLLSNLFGVKRSTQKFTVYQWRRRHLPRTVVMYMPLCSLYGSKYFEYWQPNVDNGTPLCAKVFLFLLYSEKYAYICMYIHGRRIASWDGCQFGTGGPRTIDTFCHPLLYSRSLHIPLYICLQSSEICDSCYNIDLPM